MNFNQKIARCLLAQIRWGETGPKGVSTMWMERSASLVEAVLEQSGDLSDSSPVHISQIFTFESVLERARWGHENDSEQACIDYFKVLPGFPAGALESSTLDFIPESVCELHAYLQTQIPRDEVLGSICESIHDLSKRDHLPDMIYDQCAKDLELMRETLVQIDVLEFACQAPSKSSKVSSDTHRL